MCDDEKKLKNSSLLATFFYLFFSTSLSSSKFAVFCSQKTLIRVFPSYFTSLTIGEKKRCYFVCCQVVGGTEVGVARI